MAIVDNSPVKFYFTTKAQYDYMENIEDNAIYYLVDTHEWRVGYDSIAIDEVQKLSILNPPTSDLDAVNKAYVDEAIEANKVTVDSSLDYTYESTNPVQNKVVASAMGSKVNWYSGNIVLSQKVSFTDPQSHVTFNGYKDSYIRNLIDPVLDGDAVPKKYVDNKIGDIDTVLASLTQV